MLEMLLEVATANPAAAAMSAANSPYPPSFDNNPAIFAWALFSRLLIFNLALCTIIRIRSRTASEKLPANHPVFYHRMTVTCFLWAATLGSLSDVLTYLMWGEFHDTATRVILLISRLLDGTSAVPFMMALFVQVWLRWLCEIGLVRTAPSITLNGVVNDIRVTWDKRDVPRQLALGSAAAAVLVTVGKYLMWAHHAGG